MFNSVSRHRFYPKFVSRKIGGGSGAVAVKAGGLVVVVYSAPSGMRENGVFG
jgi:hypothetical protein